MADTETSELDALFGVLVANRLLIYFGGLLVIGSPLLFGALGIELPGTVRIVLVVVTLVVMTLTYVGERRIGFAGAQAAHAGETYSLRMQIALAVAVAGIAIGVYVALEVNTVAGLLFITGAYFVGYLGYRGGSGEEA
ncbi:hypothetical protein [Halococcus thailandensis]|uniref:Uncharacterized protein n=1 Tax=Halococcus thailandensis JCM 13552 TaxID=1227457 RepID=M0N009_9EURY|nr:hypothetical protein [Halococcus thailandensis]EMA51201.1 hypothetical protein C451_15943 [Halococcus thailandensis JCM 13552]